MSKLEVDAIEPQSGTTLTIGASGDSVNIASGATITDFTSTGIDDNATSTAITIDSSERVGIGTASPDSGLHIIQDVNPVLKLDRGSANSTNLNLNYNGTLTGQISTGSNSFEVSAVGASTTAKFFTNGSERIRIDNSGNFLLGTTSVVNLGLQSIVFDGTTVNGISLKTTRALTGSNFLTFVNSSGGVAGLINHNGSTTVNYATTSDYRVKENVSYDFDATTRLKQLKPARFNFIEEPNRTVDGFLAHEVQDIIPEAIIGEKDATETKEKVVVNANGNVIAENIEQADWETGKIADENGNTQYPTDSTWEATKVVPVYQGIDQSKLVPLLVKTIQELEARITALETPSNP